MASAGIAALMFISMSVKAYDTTGYTLIWSDEFNGSSVDTSKWTPLNLPDNNNGSLEYYLPQNCTVSGGYLNLTAQNQSYGGKSYTSGCLSSSGKFSFTYGKAVAHIKMPVGQGFLPAFWMIGNFSSSWPACGEIDIMENIDGDSWVQATSHWYNNGNQQTGGTYNLAINSFHDYELEWTPTDMIYRVDGVQYADVPTSNSGCFVAPTSYYIFLNMAVGGGWPGSPNGSTPFPSTMQVDYVRVYQKTAGGGGTVANGTYKIVNRNSGQAMDASGGGTVNGTQILQWPYGGANNQRWNVTSLGNNQYEITGVQSGLSLDLYGGGTANGTKVELWTYGGGNNQKFTLTATSGGYYRITPANATGSCLEVAGSSTANGALVDLWSYTGGNNQQWIFQAP